MGGQRIYEQTSPQDSARVDVVKVYKFHIRNAWVTSYNPHLTGVMVVKEQLYVYLNKTFTLSHNEWCTSERLFGWPHGLNVYETHTEHFHYGRCVRSDPTKSFGAKHERLRGWLELQFKTKV